MYYLFNSITQNTKSLPQPRREWGLMKGRPQVIQMILAPPPAQDSRLLNAGALSWWPPPRTSPPSWLTFSLFSFSAEPKHSMWEPLTPVLHPQQLLGRG